MQRKKKDILFVGTYTDDSESKGIYTLEFDRQNLDLKIVHSFESEKNPSFLVKQDSCIYAAHERPDEGCISCYSVTQRNSLEYVNSYRSQGDAETCFLLMRPQKNYIYGANYRSGSLSCCKIRTDGSLGEGLPSEYHRGQSINKERQRTAHVHTLSFIPRTHWITAVDLGMDALVMYCTTESGVIETPPLEIVDVRPGSGPRMLAYHPKLPLAALVNELSNDVFLCSYDSTGRTWTFDVCIDLLLGRTDGLDKKEESKEPLAAHIAFSPDGSRLYASVRGEDTLTCINLTSSGEYLGKKTVPSGGAGPRHFSLSPLGNYLAVANQDSGTIALFEIDDSSDAPKLISNLAVPKPSCVIWNG